MKKTRTNLLKPLYLLSLALMVFLAIPSLFLIAEDSGTAQSTLTPININQNNGITYQYFNYPKAITSNSAFLVVADTLETDEIIIFVFDANNHSLKTEFKLTTTDLNDMFLNGSTLYTIEDGSIFSYPLNELSDPPTASLVISKESTAEFKSGFTSIFVRDIINIQDEEDAEQNEPQTEIFASVDTFVYSLTTNGQIQYTLFGNNGAIKGFTVVNETVFAVVNGRNSSRSHILRQKIGDASFTNALYDSELIESIGTKDDNSIIVLHRSSIAVYEIGMFAINKVTTALTDLILISPQSLCGLNSLGSVFSFDIELKTFSEVIASSSNNLEFFDNPTSAATRFSKLYIADKNNNRVLIKDGANTSVIDSLTSPASVAIDSDARLFVAYNENRLALFNSDNTLLTTAENEIVKIKTDTKTTPLLDIITDISLDSKDRLYILTQSNKLYIQNSDQTFSLLLENVTAVDVSPINTNLYIIQESELKRIQINSNNSITTLNTAITGEILDISIDLDEKIYVLSKNNQLDRYQITGSTCTSDGFNATIDTRLSIQKIIVSAIDTDLVSYRDLIIIDPIKSGIFILEHTKLGIDYGSLTEQETLTSKTATSLNSAVPLIRTLLRACPVYTTESEVSILTTLTEGYRVIVKNFDPTKKFTKIIADNKAQSSSQIIVGYVNTTYLSDALPYKAPPTENYSIWLHSAAIYTLPSVQAPKITGFEEVEKNTPVTLLDFVHLKATDTDFSYGYRDNFNSLQTQSEVNSLWYRISITFNGEPSEGFIPKANLSALGSDPDPSVRPQTNAVIIAKDKNFPDLGAYVYKYNNQKELYELDPTHPINPVGTKVEVVGAFDDSKPYTKIRYYTGSGTAEVYVETANIKYQGVKIGQIIAFALLFVTLALLGFLLIRYNKRRHINKGITK